MTTTMLTVPLSVRVRRAAPLFWALRLLAWLGFGPWIDPTPLAAWWMHRVARIEYRIGTAGRWHRANAEWSAG